MSLLVVGSVAIDTIESPFGSAPEVLGGSATHFALAASLFAPVRLVGVVGEDFPGSYLELLRQRGVCLEGLQVVPGRSFRWTGRYQGTMAQAETLSVELNVFGDFEPALPPAYRTSRFVFLANGSPHVQRKVLEQVEGDPFCLLDTMNLWIEIERRALLQVLERVDALVINDEEIRELTQRANLIAAARAVLELGPRTVVVKKGEHGALLVHQDRIFAAPAFPVERVLDPTGAGDTFAGGFMGTLARLGRRRPSLQDLKQAVCAGVVCASFNVEEFGPGRVLGLEPHEVLERYRAYLAMLQVDGEPVLEQVLLAAGSEGSRAGAAAG
ncbi:MAG: adenosine kinase [Planctomycetota bacterium]|nr:MAG: adenosine kinase [Planctomycetota bacterium]